jgi:hypothetical protein
MRANLNFLLPAALLLSVATSSVSSGQTVSTKPSPRASSGHASTHGRKHKAPPNTTQYCSTNGAFAFVGGGYLNVAGGAESGILAGASNKACGQDDAIGAGTLNAIYPNGGFDDESFIGAGSMNQVYSNGLGGTYGSFIGAGASNTVTAWYAGIAAGQSNLIDPAGADSLIGAGLSNVVDGEYAFVGAGQNNINLGSYSFIGAGTKNVTSLTAFVGAGSSNSAFGQNSFVGAGTHNGASGAGAVIGAGGMSFAQAGINKYNTASGTDAFIGAGDGNTVATLASFIGAGSGNAVQTTTNGGANGAVYAVIDGGYDNLITTTPTGGAQASVIAGGQSNSVSGSTAAIGGGYKNVAGGAYAQIPGGYANVANGVGSFAAGSGANALHDGTFVWSDDSATTAFASSGPYQFLARASGGFALYSNAAATAGVKLAPGSGAWSSLSDRTMKDDVVALDVATLLDRVTALPVSEWEYQSEAGVRHIGPMAQDFSAAFHVGADDRHITSIDESGVALAAIKALHAANATQRSRDLALRADSDALATDVTSLRNESTALRTRIAELRAKVSALSHGTSLSR